MMMTPEKPLMDPLVVPLTVREVGRLGPPPRWWNTEWPHDEDTAAPTEDFRPVAEAIFEYMNKKDIANPGRGWQDRIFVLELLDWYVNSTAEQRRRITGEAPLQARFQAQRSNRPADLVGSDDEIKQMIALIRNNGRPDAHVTDNGVIDSHAESIKINLLLEGLAESVTKAIQKHERKKWIVFLEGIVVGLATNGIFEALKFAVQSLTARAPNPETQLYEVEADLLQNMERWIACVQLDSEFNNSDAHLALWYSVHCLSVVSVTGGHTAGR